MKIALIFFLFSSSIYARIVFKQIRNDHLLPEKCRHLSVNNFKKVNIHYFTYGSKGSTKAGFTYEIPIHRQTARLLWLAFKDDQLEYRSYVTKLDQKPNAQIFINLITDLKDPMQFDFRSEGEILELLALKDLEKYYSKDNHFFTGGFTYRKHNGKNILGELDLIVGRKDNCTIIGVGESKLGIGALSKAKKQLKRFRKYINK